MPEPTRFFQTCFGVFQGGGCRAAAFVGAYEEAVSRRVSFAGVAGASAGSILAALIGAGTDPKTLREIISELDFRQFRASPIAPPHPHRALGHTLPIFGLTRLGPVARMWYYHGLYSSELIEQWINTILSQQTGLAGRNVRFGDLAIPTWVVATDIVSRDVKVWSTWSTPEDEVARAVRCSCSIPGFFQPVDGRFVDGGVLSNLPAFVFQHAVTAGHSPLATRVLAFALNATAEPASLRDTQQAARALIDTVVDGGSNVQQRMTDLHVIDIPTGTIRATDFESITDDAVRTLVENGRQAAAAFFDDELARVRSRRSPAGLLSGSDEIYAAVTERLDDSRVQDVWILDTRTRWLYALYPSILYWLVNGVNITVVWQRLADADPHEQLRRRLLQVMGARVREVARMPVRGYLFDSRDRVRGAGVIHVESLVDGNEVRAVRYVAPIDSAALDSLQTIAEESPGDVLSDGAAAKPSLIPTTPDDLISRLRRYVLPYGHQTAHLELNRVRVPELLSLSKVVKGFKFQQIEYLRKLFDRHGLSPFQLALARYANGSSTILTPAVAETSGAQAILIQGNTRAVYCHKNGIEEIDCVIARHVGVPLPSNQRVPVKEMLIGDRTLTTHDRYGSDIDRDYRQIELASHHPDITLVQ